MDSTPTALTETNARVRSVWDEHRDRLWRAVMAWSGDADIASDAVAEAFAQAIRRGDAIEHVDRWVWRSAFRIAGGLLAERRRLDGGTAPEIVDPAASHADVVAVLGALGSLSESDRRVVVLSLVGGWSSEQVAEISGSTAGAVRVRLHRAKKRLRAELEERDG